MNYTFIMDFCNHLRYKLKLQIKTEWSSETSQILTFMIRMKVRKDEMIGTYLKTAPNGLLAKVRHTSALYEMEI